MATNQATYTGESGVVKFTDLSTSTVINVASVRSFTLDQELDAIESTVMGSGSRTYIPGLKQFSGSLDIYFRDESGQGNINLFDAVNEGTTTSKIELYPSGETTGIKLAGDVIVTGHSITANHDGMVEASVTFQGTGALTKTAL
jgi:predicted secreted protein